MQNAEFLNSACENSATTHTISKRIQLRQCYELIDENLPKLNNISGTIRKRRTTSFNLSIQNILFNDRLFAHRDVVHIVKWIIMDNIKFKVGDFFVGFLLGGEEIPIFVKIKYILNMSEQWKFVVQCFDTVTFKQNLWCFEIKPPNNNLIFNKFSMEWNYQDVSYWLMENGFEKFVNKFQEEEIDGLSLLNLSSSSIDELQSLGTIRKRRTTSFNLSIQNILFNDRLFAHRDVVHIVKWIIMDNIKFKVGDFFVGFLLGGEEIPIFVKIKYILNMSEQWKFVVQCFDTVTFKQNLWCFEIKPPNNNLIFSKNDFISHKSEDCYYIDNSYFIRSLVTSALKQQFFRDRQISGYVSDLLLKKRQSHGHILSGRKLKFVKVDLVSHREYLIEEKQQSEECLMQLFQQAESLRTLVNTTNYGYSEVKAKMDITYPHRQRLVHEMKPVKQILELYPALSVSNLIIREINVHYDSFDGDIIQTLKSNFTKLFNYTDNPQKENITEDERPFFILEHLIMKRYKHSKKLLLNQEVLDAYPMIQVHKNNDSTNYSIIVEYNQLTTTTSQVEAVAILIGSYEIFNIEYPKKIRATLEVLHGLSFKKRSFFLVVAAKRFLSEFKINANVK
ncbi:unnamed protein product [Rotaria magnacalcarata]|uniref:SAM domain-containing protein n=2 Tax=Rotaria magnacalcarata TaxID=392030 RepID=A0A816UEP9_9BILA|nr:unnamed protein product [Rotaria magnacalcarata]